MDKEKVNMDADPGVADVDSTVGEKPGKTSSEDLVESSDHDTQLHDLEHQGLENQNMENQELERKNVEPQDLEHELELQNLEHQDLELENLGDHQDHQDQDLSWVPGGRRLFSGLLGLNVVLLGTALVAGEAYKPGSLRHVEPQLFLWLLQGLGLLWLLWYLLWARRQPDVCPHKDHHAGGIAVTLVLLLFAACSLLLCVCKMGYLISMMECRPVQLFVTLTEVPFLTLQTYLLWAHSQDCIHRHKIITRSGLMLLLSTDILLWFNAVTEDTIHAEIELEREARLEFSNSSSSEVDISDSADNSTLCQCSASATCVAFRKGVEVLYPFNMEFYLIASCLLYVMWKNVGRRMSVGHPPVSHKLTLRVVYEGGVVYGPVLGALVLGAGATFFILYQVWVSRKQLRLTAFLLFYGYHLVVMPAMSLCCLVGMLVHRLEHKASEGDRNPTRSLDVALLLGAALGQLALSYFSLVAALAVGAEGPLGGLDLSYSLLSLLELILQNIFIIEGLHKHPHLHAKRKKKRSSIFKLKKKAAEATGEMKKVEMSLLEGKSSAPEHHQRPWTKRVMQEICAFLILSNIMLWVIPAFGVHPQFENGVGKKFFGFSTWFILVNLGQPLSVFYRMHSVGALMELLMTA